LGSTTNNEYSYSLFANTTAPTSAVYYINKMNSAILKHSTGNSNAEISLSIAPFALTFEEMS